MAEEYILTRPVSLTIRAEDADRLLALGSGDAALLYLWLLRNGGRFDRSKAERELKTAGPLPAALAQLRSAGLIQGDAGSAVPPEPPVREERQEYTVDEIRQVAETDHEFRDLVDETEERLGRVLSGGDLKTLFDIYHSVGLPKGVIILLLQYCCEDIARRFGPGRKPTMRQVEKEAYIWGNRELFTIDLADAYLKERQARRGKLGELCRLLGIQNRALGATEEKYLMSWQEMGFAGEAILRAYDKTVSKKGELAWPYMNRILENWHAKGLHTPAEIEAGDAPPQSRRRASAAAGEAKPAASEYDRMRDYMKKLNGGGEHGT